MAPTISRWRAGSRADDVDRPRDVGPAEEVEDRADLVVEGDPGPELPARPADRSGQPQPGEPEERSQRPALGRQDDARPHEGHRGARVDRRGRGGLPGLHDVGEVATARWAGLGELLVTAVAVVADRGPRHEPHRVVPRGDRRRNGVGAVRARREDLVLVRGRPAVVPDPGAGEVDDAVDAVEDVRVEHAAGGVPADLVGRPRRAAHQPDDLVAALTERGDESGADQPGGSGDGDAAHGRVRTDPVRDRGRPRRRPPRDAASSS